jgi:hypothetical protein
MIAEQRNRIQASGDIKMRDLPLVRQYTEDVVVAHQVKARCGSMLEKISNDTKTLRSTENLDLHDKAEKKPENTEQASGVFQERRRSIWRR